MNQENTFMSYLLSSFPLFLYVFFCLLRKKGGHFSEFTDYLIIELLILHLLVTTGTFHLYFFFYALDWQPPRPVILRLWSLKIKRSTNFMKFTIYYEASNWEMVSWVIEQQQSVELMAIVL